jgi:hypothetical protein
MKITQSFLGRLLIPLLGILLARTIPKGIIGVVLVSIILSFIVIGLKSVGLLLTVFIIPVLISLFITPECITRSHSRNREYYGSTFNVCKYLAVHQDKITYIRLLGELIFIGSILLFSLESGGVLRVIGGLIGITLILIEVMFVHPVPLLDREYTQWKLVPNPLL